jgi:hypothetical protein
MGVRPKLATDEISSSLSSIVDATMSNGTPIRIFISYSSKDIQIAEKIERYLQQQQQEENEATYSTWRKYYLSGKFDAPISTIALSKSKNLITLGDPAGNLYAGTLHIEPS